jgi:hypothetical protein
MELELVWNGSMKDVYLCIPPLTLESVRGRPGEIPAFEKQQWNSRTNVRDALAALLPQRRVWRVKDLITYIGCPKTAVYGVLWHWKSAGLVESAGYGLVRVVAGQRLPAQEKAA